MAASVEEDLAQRLQRIAEATSTGAVTEDFKLGSVPLSALVSGRDKAGPLPYLAPEELATGNLSTPPSSKALQYSVAALLFEEVTGQYYMMLPPGRQPGALNQDELATLLQTHPPVPRRKLNQLDPRMGAVLAKALHPNPQRRYSDLQAMAANMWEVLPEPAPSEREQELQRQAETTSTKLATSLTAFSQVATAPPSTLKASQLEQQYYQKMGEVSPLLKETEVVAAGYEGLSQQTRHPLTRARLQTQADKYRQLATTSQAQYQQAETTAQRQLVAKGRKWQGPVTGVATAVAVGDERTEGKKRPLALYLVGAGVVALLLIGGLAAVLLGQPTQSGAATPIPVAVASVTPTNGVAGQPLLVTTAAATTAAATTAALTTAAATATTAPSPTSAPTAAPTVTTAPSPTVAPTVAPTATATPNPTATPVPPTAIPVPPLNIFGVGTSRRGDTEIAEVADVTGDFFPDQDVFGYIHYGDGRANVDIVEVTLVSNGQGQLPRPYIIPKNTGFFFFPLGKLGVASYKLEVRYNGNLIGTQPEFKVNQQPTQAPVQTQPPVQPPGPVRTNPPVVVTQPPVVVTQPPPVRTNPPVVTQPPAPPPGRTTCPPGSC